MNQNPAQSQEIAYFHFKHKGQFFKLKNLKSWMCYGYENEFQNLSLGAHADKIWICREKKNNCATNNEVQLN